MSKIFTLSYRDYESYHQALVKAIRVLPNFSVFHKQDWVMEKKVHADFDAAGESFLNYASERFFNERPFPAHNRYLFLTKKSAGKRLSTSAYSNILRKSIVPLQTDWNVIVFFWLQKPCRSSWCFE